MKRRRHTPEQIIRGLGEAERMLGEGKQIPDAAKELGISEATFHRWRNQYGGMKARTSAGRPQAFSFCRSIGGSTTDSGMPTDRSFIAGARAAGQRPGPAGEPGSSLAADRRPGAVERRSPRRVLPALPDR